MSRWIRSHRWPLLALTVVAWLGGAGPTVVAAAPAPAAVLSTAGLYVAVTPTRIVDTRVGLGGSSRIGADRAVAVQITSDNGVIPSSGVAAIVANVTVTNPAGPGNLAVYATGTARPTVSNVNFVAGQTVPNLVTVPISARGQIDLRNNSTGAVDVIVDVSGYYVSGTPVEPGSFRSLTPSRIVDSRINLGFGGRVPADQPIAVHVTGTGGVPASGVAAVVANVTVTEPSAPGNLSVYPTGVARPTVSNVNFVGGQTVPNLVTVPVGADGRIVLRNNSTGTTQVIVDVAGYYLAGHPTASGAFVSVTPARIVDSRIGQGLTGRVRPTETVFIGITGRGGLPGTAVGAVVANLTVTEPTAPGNLAVYPSASGPTGVSNVNFVAGQSVPNLLIAPVATDGTVKLQNNSTGPTHVIMDVAGYFIL